MTEFDPALLESLQPVVHIDPTAQTFAAPFNVVLALTVLHKMTDAPVKVRLSSPEKGEKKKKVTLEPNFWFVKSTNYRMALMTNSSLVKRIVRDNFDFCFPWDSVHFKRQPPMELVDVGGSNLQASFLDYFLESFAGDIRCLAHRPTYPPMHLIGRMHDKVAEGNLFWKFKLPFCTVSIPEVNRDGNIVPSSTFRKVWDYAVGDIINTSNMSILGQVENALDYLLQDEYLLTYGLILKSIVPTDPKTAYHFKPILPPGEVPALTAATKFMVTEWNGLVKAGGSVTQHVTPSVFTLGANPGRARTFVAEPFVPTVRDKEYCVFVHMKKADSCSIIYRVEKHHNTSGLSVVDQLTTSMNDAVVGVPFVSLSTWCNNVIKHMNTNPTIKTNTYKKVLFRIDYFTVQQHNQDGPILHGGDSENPALIRVLNEVEMVPLCHSYITDGNEGDFPVQRVISTMAECIRDFVKWPKQPEQHYIV